MFRFQRAHRSGVVALHFFASAFLIATALFSSAPRAQAQMPTELLFGIIAGDSPGETKAAWDPLLSDMSRAVGLPVRGVYASSYASIARAAREGEVHLAWLSASAALDVVLTQKMDVFAQVARIDGTLGYRSLILVRSESPLRTLDDVAAMPATLSLTRGERESVSGFILPELAFAERRIVPALHFKAIRTGTHSDNALAVANKEVDIATNNTADFVKFTERFPQEAKQVRPIWQSALILHAPVLWRTDLPVAVKDKLRRILLRYGDSANKDAKREQATLRGIHNLSGFVEANNEVLLPILDIRTATQRARALDSQFPSKAAKDARIEHIEREAALARAALK